MDRQRCRREVINPTLVAIVLVNALIDLVVLAGTLTTLNTTESGLELLHRLYLAFVVGVALVACAIAGVMAALAKRRPREVVRLSGWCGVGCFGTAVVCYLLLRQTLGA